MTKEEEIEAGLTDEEAGVRNAFARRNDYIPTFGQISRGLKDDFAFVRIGWVYRVLRDGIVLTEAQIERGLNDKFSVVSEVFKENELAMRILLERQNLIAKAIPNLQGKAKGTAL